MMILKGSYTLAQPLGHLKGLGRRLQAQDAHAPVWLAVVFRLCCNATRCRTGQTRGKTRVVGSRQLAVGLSLGCVRAPIGNMLVSVCLSYTLTSYRPP